MTDRTHSQSTQVRAASIVGAAAGAAGVFWLSKTLTDRILLSKKPNTGKLFDRLTPLDFERPSLSLSRIWNMLGPAATKSTIREFGKVHGLPLVSIFISLMWVVIVAPYIQCRTECLFIPKGEPLAAVASRIRETEDIAAIKATLPITSQTRSGMR